MSVSKNCHLISVVSGKGGVGKSIFFVNLAVSLSLQYKAPVLLMDLDQTTCGDLNILMGAKPLKALDDVLNSNQSITEKNIQNFF